MSDDQGPDISRLEEGHEVRVFYTSQRSGNEVERSGVVTHTGAVDGSQFVRVHDERLGPEKHQYVTLVESAREDSDSVAAFSETAEASQAPPARPAVGRVYVVTYSISRRSFLGPVKRAGTGQDGGGAGSLVTDGGRDGPAHDVDEVFRAMAEALRERMDKEARGAWRAGYDWLHVYDATPSFSDPTQFSISVAARPSDNPDPEPSLGDLVYSHSLDLRGGDEVFLDG